MGSFNKICLPLSILSSSKAKSKAFNSDNSNWRYAVDGPFTDKYWKTHLKGMCACDAVKQEDDINNIDGTMGIKCNWF